MKKQQQEEENICCSIFYITIAPLNASWLFTYMEIHSIVGIYAYSTLIFFELFRQIYF